MTNSRLSSCMLIQPVFFFRDRSSSFSVNPCEPAGFEYSIVRPSKDGTKHLHEPPAKEEIEPFHDRLSAVWPKDSVVIPNPTLIDQFLQSQRKENEADLPMPFQVKPFHFRKHSTGFQAGPQGIWTGLLEFGKLSSEGEGGSVPDSCAVTDGD